jgi:hypothetical protein
LESPTRLRGLKRSFGVLEVLRVAGHVPSGAVARGQVLAAWSGRGFEAWWENTLEGKKPKRVSAAGEGQLASVANGLVRGGTLRSR